jgi:RNA polymerase sigma-70 factor (ECF subfamily)
MSGDEVVMAPGMARVTAAEARADEARAIEELVHRGAHRQAIEQCVAAYAAPLGRVCMAFTGSQADTEELVQEVFVAAFDGLAQYRGEGSIRAWLFGIARRMCGRHTELRARREARLRLVHDTGRTPDASELTIERERARRAREALTTLKPSEREAVVLRYEAGLSFRELANALSIDEPAARKRVSRALARLRAEMPEE